MTSGCDICLQESGTACVYDASPKEWELHLPVLSMRDLAQYGSTEYHRQSLKNLQEAVRRTRRLCAVVLDTFGRELVIRREYEVDEKVDQLQI